MRNFSHISARYIWDRIRELSYQRSHPEMPWLAPAACEVLNSLIKSTDTVLEFGSGRSTKWFAQYAFKVISLEHSKDWLDKVGTDLEASSFDNVDLHFVAGSAAYIDLVDEIVPDGSVDISLVDGIKRDECALLSLRKVRPGGVIIIDDSQRYLPHKSRSPDRPESDEGRLGWSKFCEAAQDFRHIQFSSGVSDTTLVFVR